MGENSITKLIEANYMLFGDESKLRVSVHSSYQVQFEINQATSMLSKLKPNIQVIKFNSKLNCANSILFKLKPSIQVIKFNSKLNCANSILFKLNQS